MISAWRVLISCVTSRFLKNDAVKVILDIHSGRFFQFADIVQIYARFCTHGINHPIDIYANYVEFPFSIIYFDQIIIILMTMEHVDHQYS